MISTLKSKNLCLNCLQPGYFVKDCVSVHHHRKCQKPHHTLLEKEESPAVAQSPPTSSTFTPIHILLPFTPMSPWESNQTFCLWLVASKSKHQMGPQSKLELSLTQPPQHRLCPNEWYSPYAFLALTGVFASLVSLGSHVIRHHGILLVSRSHLSTLHIGA